MCAFLWLILCLIVSNSIADHLALTMGRWVKWLLPWSLQLMSSAWTVSDLWLSSVWSAHACIYTYNYSLLAVIIIIISSCSCKSIACMCANKDKESKKVTIVCSTVQNRLTDHGVQAELELMEHKRGGGALAPSAPLCLHHCQQSLAAEFSSHSCSYQ